MPVFICPRCAYRERGSERHVRHQPRGCSRCGFGFVFELLEDYYASPKTALIVCDQQRRILAAGHAAFAVTGYQDGELIGHEVLERLGIAGFADGDPAEKSLEWGVRMLKVDCTYRPKGASEGIPATADFFPAYDDDGGLLVALTPK
jgi:PAS domain-containing protein